MLFNPIRAPFDQDIAVANFKDALRVVSKISNISIKMKAIVLQVDRRGGMFPILRPGSDGGNNLSSSIFTIKARLLTNFYNVSDGLTPGEFDGDEVYLLPNSSVNIIDIPEPGEIVLVELDRPFSTDGRYIGYWIGRANNFLTRDSEKFFNRNEVGGSSYITHDMDAIFSGKAPEVINRDYDVKPEWNYEPFPQIRRFLSGDVTMIGKSNTSLTHSFNPHIEGDKRGLIELITEADYIHNEKPLLAFNWAQATEAQREEFAKIQEEHVKYYLDAFRRTSKNQFLNSRGTRALFATKVNIDRHLIHKDSEKDGTGEYGNVQKTYDKHFRDQGPGPEPTSEDKERGIKRIGMEILEEPLTSILEFENSHGDVSEVMSNGRGEINFDKAVAAIMLEYQNIYLISRDGEEINHAVLAERQGRWLQELLTLILHQNRTIDILRDRVHRLALDFLKHRHAVVPGQTLTALGSPDAPGSFIKEHVYYKPTTKGDVAGDSTFEEAGSDSTSMTIKARLSEEREKLENLIRAIPEHHSKTVALN